MIEQAIIDNLPAMIIGVFTAGGVYKIIEYRLNSHAVRIDKLETQNEDLIKMGVNIKWIMGAITDLRQELGEVKKSLKNCKEDDLY